MPATTCSNGIAWSPDGATMYYIDSLAGGIDAYSYDRERGGIAGRRRLIDVPESEGLPDGLCVDARGISGSQCGAAARSAATRPTGRSTGAWRSRRAT